MLFMKKYVFSNLERLILLLGCDIYECYLFIYECYVLNTIE